ncbi:MAG: amidohydrolase [Synergistaceae bacterium]|jgi:amidohydrolase|nr:amidohydrolase [Synergistaceae bacterium]
MYQKAEASQKAEAYRKIEDLARKYAPAVTEWRRAIHRCPELSTQEEKTAALAAEVLTGLGVEVRKNVGGHGVVGLLRGAGQGAGKTVGLRADMDALPMQEDTGLPFASETPGVMHACGHDTHTAMLLGAACVLTELKKDLPGAVKFIFQPAEELNPTGGAPGMIRDGVLENPRVDALFALHVWPGFETGKIASRAGALMGASDRVFVTVSGRTSHGSAPHQGVDAIVIASQIVGGLQTIVSRSVAPLDSAVVSIGTIRGGYRYNVIADSVEMEGTVRTLSPGTQEQMPGRIERAAQGYARALGGDAAVRYVRGYPPTLNAPELFQIASAAVTDSMGAEHLVNIENPDLGGEDFSFFARERPSLMAWLGCRPAGKTAAETAVLHNTRFDPDEACFPWGIRFLASCAADFLRQ